MFGRNRHPRALDCVCEVQKVAYCRTDSVLIKAVYVNTVALVVVGIVLKLGRGVSDGSGGGGDTVCGSS